MYASTTISSSIIDLAVLYFAPQRLSAEFSDEDAHRAGRTKSTSSITWNSARFAQGAIMDIQKRVAALEIQRIHFTLPRLSLAHLSSRRLALSLVRHPVRPRGSTYGCSFGNHIFFVSQFAAPLNALPPFRRGCISVAAARYKFWRRPRARWGG